MNEGSRSNVISLSFKLQHGQKEYTAVTVITIDICILMCITCID